MSKSPRGFMALLSVFLSISARGELVCAPESRSVQETTDTGEVAEWCERNGQRDGSYRLFISGKLVREGQYEKGSLSGEWKRYHSNGRLKDIGFWRENKPEGLWRFFGEDGTMVREIRFEDGKELSLPEADPFLRQWTLEGAVEGIGRTPADKK